MNPFVWKAPTKYVFGEGAVDKVGEELAAAGWKHVLIVYGQGSVVRSGLLDRVKDRLGAAGVAMCLISGRKLKKYRYVEN